MIRRIFFSLLVISILLFPGCLASNQSLEVEDNESTIELVVWHSFAAESKEQATFESKIDQFMASNPSVEVKISAIPYTEADNQFMVAAQGGEAPDVVRLSNDQLGKIGHVRVGGQPLLEDLRAHLTPIERSKFDPRALNAMRYEGDLLGIPASQDCLSLLFNPVLFDAAGVDYPDENWTLDDMLLAASTLTSGDVSGLALPVKDPYWWFGFQAGFGGSLFDQNGTPSLNSNGSSDSMDWILDLELEHEIVQTGTNKESMKNQFLSSKVAMIIDGPWNWATYEAGRIPLKQSVLPIVTDSGERISPLVTFKGWSVSKQSLNKEWSTKLALYLSSSDVQKEFAIETYTMPTTIDLYDNPDISENIVLSGFLEQLMEGTPAPTTRGMSLVYAPMGTAFENVYTGALNSSEALLLANESLQSELEGN